MIVQMSSNWIDNYRFRLAPLSPHCAVTETLAAAAPSNAGSAGYHRVHEFMLLSIFSLVTIMTAYQQSLHWQVVVFMILIC